MLKKLLLGMMLLISSVAMADLLVKIGQVCQQGICYVQKKAEDIIQSAVREATKPIGLDIDKVDKTGQKLKKDIAQLKADLELLKKQAGQDGNTYSSAKKINDAIDDIERTVKNLKKVTPPFSKVELVTAVTGVPGFVEKLYGGRSSQVKTYFDQLLAQYGIIRDNVPKLETQELGIRAQIVISEVVAIMDDVTDLRKASGTIGDKFFSEPLTTNFRALRDDLMKITTRIGTIVAYKSFVVGGPLNNTDLAKRVGGGIIGNFFDIASASQTSAKIGKSLASIKSLVDTLKREGEMLEDKGKTLEQKAKFSYLVENIKKKIGQVDPLTEAKNSIREVRMEVREIITLALVMIEQVAEIINNAYLIGKNVDDLMGGNFIQPAIISALSALSGDLKDVNLHAGNIHSELKKTLPSI